MSEARKPSLLSTWTLPKASKALFCTQCGAIMNLPDSFNDIKCPDCPYSFNGTLLSTTCPSSTRALLHSYKTSSIAAQQCIISIAS